MSSVFRDRDSGGGGRCSPECGNDVGFGWLVWLLRRRFGFPIYAALIVSTTTDEEDFVCLVGSQQRVGRRRFTLKRYLDLPHAVVETWEAQQGPLDRPLAELGLKRHTALRVPYFVPTILAIARTDLILTLPRRLARITRSMAGLRLVEPPREIKGFSYFMAWHPRLTTEPAQQWFREQVRMTARAL